MASNEEKNDARNIAQLAARAPAGALKVYPGNPARVDDGGAGQSLTAALPRTARDPIEQAAFAQKMQQGAGRNALANGQQRPSLLQGLDSLPERMGQALQQGAERAGHFINNATINPLQTGLGGGLAVMGTLLPGAAPLRTIGQGLIANSVRYDPASAAQEQQAQPAAAASATQAKPALTQDPAQWGRTAYGNAVGRRGAQGYEFSNQAGDIAASANNQFTGRDGTAGRISNKGSFNTMRSEDMWRPLGGQQGAARDLAGGLYADGGARSAGRTRLPDSLQDIRSNGVTVVGGEDTALRNAAVQTESRGKELLRAARNSNRRSEFRNLSQAGADMLKRADGINGSRATAPGQRAEQQAARQQEWAEGAGRRQREGLENQALALQNQVGSEAYQAQREQMARVQQMQSVLSDPRSTPEQRKLAYQSLQLMQPPRDAKGFMPVNLGEDANSGANRGQAVFDPRSGQFFYPQGGQAGGMDLSAFPDGQVFEDASGNLAMRSKKYGEEVLPR